MIRTVSILAIVAATAACAGRSGRSSRQDRDAAVDEDAPSGSAIDAGTSGATDAGTVHWCDMDEYDPYYPECPASTPYCCDYGVDFGHACFGPADTPSTDDLCREHPSTGTRMTCDPTDGTGCPADQPICCADYDAEANGTPQVTYCSNHAFLVTTGEGMAWECSQ